MNRVEIKRKSKELASNHLWNFWKGYLIILGIEIILSLILGVSLHANEMTQSIISMLITIIISPITLGFNYYVLNIIRGKSFSIEDVWKYIKKFLPIFILQVIIIVFVILWSILLIIPGIIASISYAMATYIYIDTEEEPMECIKKSQEMMKGYKMDYFIFILSFIGWMLLGVLTCGILYIFILPYFMIATLMYYDELKKHKKM